MADKEYFLTESEIMKSEAYKHFTKTLMTKGSVLSSRVVNGELFEFAKVQDDNCTLILSTVESRIWCLVSAFSFPEGNETLYAFNKDLIEELENGQE